MAINNNTVTCTRVGVLQAAAVYITVMEKAVHASHLQGPPILALRYHENGNNMFNQGYRAIQLMSEDAAPSPE